MDAVRRTAAAIALLTAAPAHAVTINQFPPAGGLSATDQIPLYQNGTVRTTLGDLATFLALQIGTGSASLPSNLGTAAYASIGVSGNSVPLLNTNNSWSGVQIYTGLNAGLGGHTVGTGDFTTSQTLTAANEDVIFTCTASCTGTLPPNPQDGALVAVHDLSGQKGLLTVAVATAGVRLLTPTGPATSYTYAQQYQAAKWVYHAASSIWVPE